MQKLPSEIYQNPNCENERRANKVKMQCKKHRSLIKIQFEQNEHKFTKNF